MQIEDQFELAFLDAFRRYVKREKDKNIDLKKVLKQKKDLSFLKDKDYGKYGICLWDDKISITLNTKKKRYITTIYDCGEVYTSILENQQFSIHEGILLGE